MVNVYIYVNSATLLAIIIKQYYLKLCEHLLKNLSLSNSFLSNLEFLNPLSRTIENENKVLYCAKKLHSGANIGHKYIDALSTEWKNLVLENIPKDWFTDEIQKYNPLDSYWCRIFKIKDSNNEMKYPIMTKVVKSCFAIAEANADGETFQPDKSYHSKITQLFELRYCKRDSLQQRSVSCC